MYNLLQLPKLQEAQDLHFDVMYDYICCKLGVKKNDESEYKEICGVRRFQGNEIEKQKQINALIGYFLLNESPFFKKERLEVLLKGSPRDLVQINKEFEDFIIIIVLDISKNFNLIGSINLKAWNWNLLESLDIQKEERRLNRINYGGSKYWLLYLQYKEFIQNNYSNKSSGILHDIYKELSLIFNYDTFKGWQPSQVYSSYKLAELLGMRACTYCNRDYILVHRDNDNGKLLCPQYDHWFPKSKYPLLQVSFYNLIPSCGSCNSSVKGDTLLDIENYCHPYMEWDDDEMFYYTYYLNLPFTSEYRVKAKSLKEDSKLLTTIKKLKIDQMYNGHIPELEDLIDLKEAYGDNYLRTLTSSFPKLRSFTKNEVYRMHFGTEKDEVDFYKKPMSKFKKDILKKLKLIDELE